MTGNRFGDRHGVAAVEFAVVAPVLILLILATTDLVQFLRTQMRLDATAVQVGQVVSQCNHITSPGDTNQFWSYADRIMGSVGSVSSPTTQGAVIISAVYSQNGRNKVAWQRRAGSATQASSVGTQGGTATIAEGFVVPSGQTLFVTEVYLPTPGLGAQRRHHGQQPAQGAERQDAVPDARGGCALAAAGANEQQQSGLHGLKEATT